ncbi:2OG-Fe(II) oxygenase superfamily protein [Tistlia consotensis]|uniref:2OG-Fe(II) oxygenase superfamily protein n=1 Tax=Tistlia consotensis USBA 355 TaxID=560819 RepID=A0A1Y6CLC7_9PROT|nr:2OG-Fe(II) oxygenase [Tistlia consotensis]SMF75407.1 2OG-Fe(II) oxygenase superfamily protein [Tistlia consotensis USBA 355]SNS08222.1 2OG-Fe(II) oxygenase superfamily protein [Tistlia consotensis]
MAEAKAIERPQGLLDLERFAATPLVREPFDHLIVPAFLRPEAMPRVAADFPAIEEGGSFPVASLRCGPAFEELLAEIQSRRTAEVLGEKFGLDLTDKPVMITVRGQSREKDGRVHTDSKSKLLTVLIYMNDAWDSSGGRLRLLRRPDDLEDFVAEVPPHQGTLLAFRCADNAWHGHKPFVGQRRSIQVNWMHHSSVAWREQARHRLSALAKRLFARHG